MLVPIDLRDREPTAASLFALSEGRRVAHAAGATVFAIVLTDRNLGDGALARLGRAGADKVLLCEGPGLDAPPLDATHGSALFAAVERIPPLLVLFPGGGAGTELGPALASRLGAAFAATADLELGEALTPLADGVGRVFLRRWRRDLSSYRRLDPVELERPVVAILPSGGLAMELGTDNVEVEVISCAAPAKVGVAEVSSEVDQDDGVALASVLIAVDPSFGGEAVDKLRAAAPPGVAVIDASAAPAAASASVPRIVISIGTREVGVFGTPRSRIAVVTASGGDAPPKSPTDVLFRIPADRPLDQIWQELAGILRKLAPGTAAS